MHNCPLTGYNVRFRCHQQHSASLECGKINWLDNKPKENGINPLLKSKSELIRSAAHTITMNGEKAVTLTHTEMCVEGDAGIVWLAA